MPIAVGTFPALHRYQRYTLHSANLIDTRKTRVCIRRATTFPHHSWQLPHELSTKQYLPAAVLSISHTKHKIYFQLSGNSTHPSSGSEDTAHATHPHQSTFANILTDLERSRISLSSTRISKYRGTFRYSRAVRDSPKSGRPSMSGTSSS